MSFYFQLKPKNSLVYLGHRSYFVLYNGLVSRGVSLTSWGERASLALVGHSSSDSFMMKIPYGVDVLLHRPVSHLIFSYWVGLILNLFLLLDPLRLA